MGQAPVRHRRPLRAERAGAQLLAISDPLAFHARVRVRVAELSFDLTAAAPKGRGT
jgi:hypothetical protein